MHRFIAMIWDARESPPRAVAAWRNTLEAASIPWTILLDAPGLAVHSLARHSGFARLSGEDGIVLGPLFRRGEERLGPRFALDARESASVVESGGENLVYDFWGGFVALWREPRSGDVGVLRDPCGALPCFVARVDGVELLFSHAEDVASLPGVRFSVDWTYLRAFLAFNYFVTPHTGLGEVREVLAGERRLYRCGTLAHSSFLWNGAAVAAHPSRATFTQAKAALREAGEAACAAWGHAYERIVVSLSGGLDSSILINLLRRTCEAEITALHYVGVDYERYEVELARTAAAHAGVELIEMQQDPAADRVERILSAPRLARPKLQTLAVQIDDISLDVAARNGASSFMLGQGGDNLFLQRGGANHSFSDYLQLHGLGRKFWDHAYDAATLQQKSVSSILMEAARALSTPWRPLAFLGQGDWARWRPFTHGALDTIPAEYMLHPWLAQASALPCGKTDQLFSFIALYHYYLDHGRGLTHEVVYPFISQPIVELALRTPSYVLVQGGEDRALERAAFAEFIPAAIARRTAKGGANLYSLRVMQDRLDFYRALILDGTLVRQDWIDRAKVESMLKPEFVIGGGGAMYLYLLVAAEAWLHGWASGAPAHPPESAERPKRHPPAPYRCTDAAHQT